MNDTRDHFRIIVFFSKQTAFKRRDFLSFILLDDERWGFVKSSKVVGIYTT